MSHFQSLQLPAVSRRVSLVLELIDAVTLQRVYQGVSVIAEGLRRKPIRNASGLFVWLGEDIAQLRSISIDTGVLPFEGVVLSPANVQQPLTTIELPPRLDYPFTTGVTGLRGTLIETSVVSPERKEPVIGAKINLSWLNEDNEWENSAIKSHTDSGGDFVSIVRFAPSQKPMLDSTGAISVRLQVSREGWNVRHSNVLKIVQGRIANPTALEPLIFVWNELLP